MVASVNMPTWKHHRRTNGAQHSKFELCSWAFRRPSSQYSLVLEDKTGWVYSQSFINQSISTFAGPAEYSRTIGSIGWKHPEEDQKMYSWDRQVYDLWNINGLHFGHKGVPGSENARSLCFKSFKGMTSLGSLIMYTDHRLHDWDTNVADHFIKDRAGAEQQGRGRETSCLFFFTRGVLSNIHMGMYTVLNFDIVRLRV